MSTNSALASRSPAPGPGVYAKPILTGLLILIGAQVPWLVLSRWNASLRPDIPWAALVTLAYVAVLVVWLNGSGPPSRSRSTRQRRLRLWPQASFVRDRETIVWAVAGLLVLSLLWTMTGRLAQMPDLDAYPTTAYRWSMFLMGGLMAGIIEESAFRGYMQSGIEEFDSKNAIWITSLVFAASHITHGLTAVLLLGPGFFVASMLYGTLARATGTILPGMLIHVLGDLSYVYFGVLHGDASLLFANN